MPADTPDPDHDPEIAVLEAELRAAMLAGDVPTLDRLISERLLFAGPDGALATKADDLRAHRQRLVRFIRHEPETTEMRRVNAETVVVSQATYLEVAVGDTVHRGSFRYTRVWAREPDGWRIVAGNVSAIPRPVANEAAKPNPALAPFAVLVGDWNTVGTHPLVPGTTFHGRTSFEWLEGGAFLVMRSRIDEPEIPSGIAIFGTDDATGECSMVYFDERGVSRRYEVSLRDNVWRWWRHTPEFSQRATATISSDGRTIESRGELLRDGEHWEGDLALTYTRAE